MKKVFILMLGLVASTASFATTHEPSAAAAAQTRLVMTSTNTIKLVVQPLQTKGLLTLWDADGRAVYTETVNLQKGLSQQFDYSGLGTGTYRFTRTAGAATVTKLFVVQANPNQSFVVQEP